MADKVEQPVARPQTAADRYEHLTKEREPFLTRAWDAAELTIPGLLPRRGHNATSNLPQPYQSVGADGLNNLSSKLLLVLFPPGQPFFKLELDDFVAETLAKKFTDPKESADAIATFDAALGKIERAVVNRMDESGSRMEKFEAIKHLIACGNALYHVQEDGTEKMYPLDKYVVKRDLSGNVLEIIVEECLDKKSLPLKAQALVKIDTKGNDDQNEEVDLYTWIQRQPNGGFKVHQEIEGEIVPGTEGYYPKDKSAFLALRWNKVSGESYGRGRVEEYIGDMRSCESGTQSVIELAAAAAKILFLVDESGVTEKKTLQNANSGDIVDGNMKDVTVLQLEKMQDFGVLSGVVAKVEQRLEKAFLLASSVQRNAERVTAEEIRTMIAELETALGGTYAVLSSEFQRPLVIRVMHQMTMKKQLPVLPDGTVSPKIVTGLEGLGRATDLQKLDQFITGVSQEFGPAVVAQYINVGAYMKLRGAALGVNLAGLVKTDDEVAAAAQQQQSADMVNKLGPSAIGAISKQTQDYNKNAATQGQIAQGQQPGAQPAIPRR